MKSSIDAETMTRSHEWVPDLLARDTDGNFKDSLYEIENQVALDIQINPDEDEHIVFSGWGKDAKILEQDRESDEEDHEAIDNS